MPPQLRRRNSGERRGAGTFAVAHLFRTLDNLAVKQLLPVFHAAAARADLLGHRDTWEQQESTQLKVLNRPFYMTFGHEGFHLTLEAAAMLLAFDVVESQKLPLPPALRLPPALGLRSAIRLSP